MLLINWSRKNMHTKEVLRQIFYGALRAVDPYLVIKKYSEKIRMEYELSLIHI